MDRGMLERGGDGEGKWRKERNFHFHVMNERKKLLSCARERGRNFSSLSPSNILSSYTLKCEWDEER